jgi:hypothetical protein
MVPDDFFHSLNKRQTPSFLVTKIVFPQLSSVRIRMVGTTPPLPVRALSISVTPSIVHFCRIYYAAQDALLLLVAL